MKIKKIISRIVSAIMIITSLNFTAFAEDKTIDKIYADSFGLDVIYSEAVAEDDFAGMTFVDNAGNAVEFTTAIEDKTLHVNFATPIATGSRYILSIGGVQKAVTVNEEFFEDFENENAQLINSTALEYSGKWKFNANSNSLITETNTISGNRTAAIGGEKFLVRKWTSVADKDLTVSIDVAPYKMEGKNGDKAILAVRGQSYGFNRSYGAFIDPWTAAVGIYESGNLKEDYKKTVSMSPAYGEMKTITANAEGNILAQAGLEVTKTVASKKYAVRNYDNVVGSYYDGTYVGTVVDTRTGVDASNTEVPYTKGEIVVGGTANGVILFDNVLVTSCTVADYVPNSIDKIYADNFGVDIIYKNTIAAGDYEEITFTDKNGTPVQFTKQEEDNIVHLHFTNPITIGERYVLSIDGTLKSITINEEFFEDFENENAQIFSSAIDNTQTKGWKFNAGLITDINTIAGSKTAAVQNEKFLVRKWTSVADKDLTISIDVAPYKIGTANGGKVILATRGQSYGFNRSYGAFIDQWGAAVGIFTNGDMADATFKKYVSKSPAYGNITSIDKDAEGNILEQAGFEITTPVESKKYAVRNYDNVVGSYYDGSYTATIKDTRTVDSSNISTPYTKGEMGVQGTANNVVFFDNVLVTSCTVADFKETELIELVNADNYGVVLDTPVVLGAINDLTGLTITNVATNEKVTPTKASYTGTYLYVDAPLECDTPYMVSVAEGFSGAEAMLTKSYKAFFKVKNVKSISGTDSEDLASIGLSPLQDSSRSVVMKDDYVEIHNKSFNVGPFDSHVSISYKLAYYALDGEWGPKELSSNNIIKGNGDTVNYTPEGKTEQTLQKGAITLYMSAKNTTNNVGGEPTNNEAKVTITKADGTVVQWQEVTTFATDLGKGIFTKTDNVVNVPENIEPHVERYVMTNDTYRIYKDSDYVYGFVQEGLNESGYVQIGGSSGSVVQFYGADVTRMELIEEMNLNVTEIAADANNIYVTFNDSVQAVSDFSNIAVTADNQAVEAAYSANGKTVTITPNAGIISDALYKVTVNAGFGPSELLKTKSAYNKNFTVTVYANETFTDELTADSDVKVDADNVIYADDGIVYRNGTFGINNAQMAANDYTLKFDYKVYSAVIDNLDMTYDTAVPNSNLWFNSPEYASTLPNGVYSWLIESDGVTKNVDGAEKEALETAFGDASYYNNAFEIYKTGDDLRDFGLTNSDNTGVTYGSHTAELYTFTLEKQGAGASLYRNDALISTFTGDEMENALPNGYFGMSASDKEYIWIDNVQAYTFKEAEGIFAEIDVETSMVNIENYDNSAKDAVIIVAAYDDNNMMLDAYESDVKKIQSGSSSVPFTFTNADTAVTYKAFIWDSLTSLKPYCTPAIADVQPKQYGADVLANTDNNITAVFLGDSVYQGSGATSEANNHASLVAAELDKVYNEVTLINSGIGGTTSQQGLYRVQKDVARYEPDIVFVNFAINDKYYSEANYKAYTEGIVRELIKLPKQPVIILEAPAATWADENGVYSDDSKNYPADITWMKEIAQKYGILVVDYHSYIAQEIANGTITDWTAYADTYTTDGVHPNDDGYKKWSDYTWSCIKDNLNGKYSLYNVEATFDFRNPGLVPVTSQRVDYDSSWEYKNAGTTGVNKQFEKGVIASSAAGDELTFTFSGKSIGVYGNRGKTGNTASYSIDGGKYSGTIDSYGNYNDMPIVLFERHDLSEGTHTLKIVTNEPTEERNTFTIGYFLTDEPDNE